MISSWEKAARAYKYCHPECKFCPLYKIDECLKDVQCYDAIFSWAMDNELRRIPGDYPDEGVTVVLYDLKTKKPYIGSFVGNTFMTPRGRPYMRAFSHWAPIPLFRRGK